MSRQIRVGILGCGPAAWYAIVDPARAVPDVHVAAVASRTVEHGRRFATEHGIPRHHETYDALIEDESIDLVYIAVPTRLHGYWAKRAIERKKSVLCEKPLARNEAEAVHLFDCAASAGVSLIEGMHYRHHPVTARVLSLIEHEAIGRLLTVDTGFEVPSGITPPTHSRLNREHSGGAALDPGCYCVNLLRLLTGEEPVEVSAVARKFAEDVDIAMQATLRFPGACVGSFTSTLDSPEAAVRTWLKITGERGEIRIANPYGPHADPSIRVTVGGRTSVERLSDRMTFSFQLQNVVSALIRDPATASTAADSIGNMRAIDDVYRAAGLTPR